MENHQNFKIILLLLLLITICFLHSSLQERVNVLNLDEGKVCRKSKGSEQEYVCIDPIRCGPFVKDIHSRNYPDICSFQGFKPIICCPKRMLIVQDMIVKKSNIANEKCRQYSGLKFPKKQTFHISVVGGTEAKPQEFPHMAIIGYGETAEQGRWGCGGSLISDRWILTAAHCLTNYWGKARWARVGDLNIVSKTDNARPKDYQIVQHVLHPDFKPPSRYNDIALFRLKTKVEFSAYVRPICLNTDQSLNPVKQIATGWGRTALADKTSDGLLKVDLDFISEAQCNNSYFSEDNPQLQFGITPDSMVCAGSKNGGRDTCVGDSGGPLQIQNIANSTIYTQIGITAFGKFCGDKNAPGVYTRVSKYISWIEGIVWPNN